MTLDWRKILGLSHEPYPETTTMGPDFPTSAGDRERGKFRPSEHPRLTAVAVVTDDGEEVASGTDALLRQLIHVVERQTQALVLGGLAEDLGDFETGE